MLTEDTVTNMEPFTLAIDDLSSEITLSGNKLKEQENVFLLMEYSLDKEV